MTQLDRALLGLQNHDGVEQVLLVGMDGLLVHSVGDGPGLDLDRVAAMAPGIVSSSATFAQAAGGEDIATVVLELQRGVGVVMPLSPDLLLVALLRSGVGFAPLLREVRQNRAELAALI